MPINNYLLILREKGLKVTPRRKAVIDLFLREGRYLGPYRIRDMLKKLSLKAGLPSIYRILQELEKAGILVKVAHQNRQLYYGLCRNPHKDHHHFICRKCNKVEEVEFCNFGEISRFVERKLKGRVEQHSLHIEGLCSECR